MESLATREDIANETKSTLKWIVGALIASIGLGVAIIIAYVRVSPHSP